jgi:hypothetical protein
MDESTDGERVVKTGERIQEVLEQSTDANNDLLVRCPCGLSPIG